MTDLRENLANDAWRLAQQLFPRGWVVDAVAWVRDETMYAAWVMPPEKLSRLVGPDEGHMPLKAEAVARALRSVGLSDDDFRYERGEQVAYDFLDRLSNTFYSHSDGNNGTRFTLIAAPGYPWPTDDGLFFSAKQGRFLASEEPDWLLPEIIKKPDRGISGFGVDLCGFWPEPTYESAGLVYPMGSRYLIATHAMGSFSGITRTRTWDENARVVRECGGLLAPSLAAGMIPATNFGPFVLVADVGIVLSSLKPFRRRGIAPAKVFNTDAWTVVTKELLEDGAMAAFDQLHGHADYLSYHSLQPWTIGTPERISTAVDFVKRFDSVAQLEKALAKRMSIWKRDLDPEQIERVSERAGTTSDRYAYFEVKVDGVMPISSFPAAVAPRGHESGFASFLEATGFEGDLLTVDLPDEVLAVLQDDWGPPDIPFARRTAIQAWAAMSYGWHVADEILAYAGVGR
jgi:hypothetical protein